MMTRSVIITEGMIRDYLQQSGWVNVRPGYVFSWKDPVSKLGNYSLMGALENQLGYDTARSANAVNPKSVSIAKESTSI